MNRLFILAMVMAMAMPLVSAGIFDGTSFRFTSVGPGFNPVNHLSNGNARFAISSNGYNAGYYNDYTHTSAYFSETKPGGFKINMQGQRPVYTTYSPNSKHVQRGGLQVTQFNTYSGNHGLFINRNHYGSYSGRGFVGSSTFRSSSIPQRGYYSSGYNSWGTYNNANTYGVRHYGAHTSSYVTPRTYTYPRAYY